MSVVNILQYPHKDLRRHGVKVTDFGPEMQQVIDDMFETHYAQDNCAALAATQLDIPNAPHITVIDYSAEKNQPLCIVNGEIIEREGEVIDTEACMSVGTGGAVYAKVKRADKIKLRAQDRNGETFELEADGFLSKCIQHELDHLEGVLFIDYLSPLKRKRLEKQLENHRRRNQG